MDNTVDEECVFFIPEMEDEFIGVDPIDIMPECYNGLKRSSSPPIEDTLTTSAPSAKKRRRRRKLQQNFAAMAVDMKRQIQELKQTVERNESTNAARYNTLLEKHETLVKQTDTATSPSSSLPAPDDRDNTQANEVESESDDDDEGSLDDERYKTLSDKIDTVLTAVHALSQTNKALFDLVKSLKIKVFKNIEFDGSFSPPELPLRKTTDLDELNGQLEDDTFRDQMVLRLSPYCIGISVMVKVRHLMEMLLDYRLTILYTWSGKLSLNNSDKRTHSFATKGNILKLVISCIRYRETANVLDKEIITAIHDYVRRAKEVCRSRNKLSKINTLTSTS